MPDYTIVLTKKAEKQLDRLSDNIAEPIFAAIQKLAKDPRPSGCKKLTGKNAYRIRVGDYRVIYSIIDKKLVIDIIAIGHRKDIYE